eukprot:COSAG02_NODE_28432_length_589_cov_9.865306_1_plen_50_part_10
MVPWWPAGGTHEARLVSTAGGYHCTHARRDGDDGAAAAQGGAHAGVDRLR